MSVEVESLMPEVETVEEPKLPDVEVTTDPPEDKPAQARAEDGKFKGKEEPKPEAKPEKVEQKEPRTIPLAAHLEERKALKAELDGLRKELEALKNPPKAPAPEPVFQDDPKAYTDHKVQSALEALEKQKQEVETVKQTAQQSVQETEALRFSQTLQAAEAAFVKETPDYFEALDYLRQRRADQLLFFNPDITQEQIARVIVNEEMNLARQLAQMGRNPISSAYELAKRNGYQKKQPSNVTQLPNVPGPKQLPPDQTLGSGDGGGGDEADAESKDPFAEAFAEMFGKRKAS